MNREDEKNKPHLRSLPEAAAEKECGTADIRGRTAEQIPRFMIAAPSSGSGKTMLTCGILRLLQRRGLQPAAFKCGPDYIDPMFHRQVLGIPSRNLDTFFLPDGGVRRILTDGVKKHSADLAVIEGVMGYFDGTGKNGMQASSFELALQTQTPVILAVNAKGMSRSIIPLLRGFSDYEKKHLPAPPAAGPAEYKPCIKGAILNRVSAGMFPAMKKWIEEETDLRVIGFLPQTDELSWGSRHLGLMQPQEITDLQAQIDRLAKTLEKTLDTDLLLELAASAPPAEPFDFNAPNVLPTPPRTEPEDIINPGAPAFIHKNAAPRIAVARDEAFSFYYEENLDLLRAYGAELLFFSPIQDETIPEADALLLGGGYPELHAAALAANESMKNRIRSFAEEDIPILAECGGFMYLQEKLQIDGKEYPMCGVLPGTCRMTDRLVRFGYIEINPNPLISAPAGTHRTGYLSPGHTIRGHEFHYFDSTDNGNSCRAARPTGSRSWDCIVTKGNIMAGFPHLYYPSDPQFILNFLQAAGDHPVRA